MQCLRAPSACICRWIAAVAPRTQVLILQHPLEVHNAKNSARLLHLCLAGSRIVEGETFDGDELAHALHADERQPVLLYPAAAGDIVVAPAALDPSRVRLVVLDGTWRKSRKMLHANPVLAALPRIALDDAPASHYRIRKAHRPDQLSTFEATVYALAQLEGEGNLGRLMDTFDGFVAQHAHFARGP
jgi:DTW domain-containing protein YfiP